MVNRQQSRPLSYLSHPNGVRRVDAALHLLPRRAASRGDGQLLGHRDVSTTMIYTHVLNRGPAGVRSPADRMLGL